MVLIGKSITSLGTMNTHITFGDEHCSNIIIAKFMVVNIPLVYNMIIG